MDGVVIVRLLFLSDMRRRAFFRWYDIVELIGVAVVVVVVVDGGGTTRATKEISTGRVCRRYNNSTLVVIEEDFQKSLSLYGRVVGVRVSSRQDFWFFLLLPLNFEFRLVIYPHESEMSFKRTNRIEVLGVWNIYKYGSLDIYLNPWYIVCRHLWGSMNTVNGSAVSSIVPHSRCHITVLWYVGMTVILVCVCIHTLNKSSPHGHSNPSEKRPKTVSIDNTDNGEDTDEGQRG